MTDQGTMGAYLRAARRRRRVSIERAAEETRIRPDFLMRMESDEFDFLAPAYVRGFLRTYTRFLGLKTEPFLDEFDRRFGTARADTASLIALERRSQRAPRERRRMSSWTLAASMAGAALLLLAVVGVLSSGDGEPKRVALIEDSESPSPATTSPSPSATPTPTQGTIALTDGIDIEIVAASHDCWVDVTADGTKVFSDTIPLGEAQTFTADSEMTLILGFPEGVEMTVNGTAIGSPGGVDPITIKLPEDLDSLLSGV